MAKRQRRRPGTGAGSYAPDRAPRRNNGVRILVLLAVVGLVLLSMASLGSVAGPVPSPSALL